MLDQFINKIHSVQKDLYSNFTLKKNEELKLDCDGDIDFKIGSDLLIHYQKKWTYLHKSMEKNVNLIKDNNKILKEINDLSDVQLESQKNFNLSLFNFNEIENNLKELNQDLNNVQKSLLQLENCLFNLENKKFKFLLKKIEKDQELKLKLDSENKYNELDEFKLKLLGDHKKKAKAIESLQSGKLKEKQRLYQQNLEKDFETFKRYGKLLNEPKNEVNVDELAKTLEEVDVEPDILDEKALDDFLNN